MNRYVVIVESIDKETKKESRYCHIMDYKQFDHYEKSEGLHYSPWKLIDRGVYEKETCYTVEKVIVKCLPFENVTIHNEIYV